MAGRLAVIGGVEHGRDHAAVGDLPANVNMAEGQGKINGDRDQREP